MLALFAVALMGCDEQQFSTGSNAQLVVEPEVVTFAQVPVGESVDRVVKVRNEGDNTLFLTFDNYVLEPASADFVFTYMRKGGEDIESLEPGEEAEMQISYYPQPPDIIGNATLTLKSDNGGEATIVLQSIEPAPVLDVNPNPVAFGSVSQGTQEDMEVTISNGGSEDLVIDSLTYAAENTSDFILLETLETLPLTLAPGESDSIVVRYEPSGDPSQPDRGNLIFLSNSVTAEVTNGRTVVEVLGGASAPRIEIAPAFVDFGGVEKNVTATETLTVSNVGQDPLEVSGVFLALGSSTEFSYSDADSFSLQPGEERTLDVSYTPIDSALDTGELVFESNDPTSPSVPVSLVGQWAGPDLVVKPLDLDFGQVSTGISKTLTFDIFNQGILPLDITGIVPSGFPADGSLTLTAAPGNAGSLDPFQAFTLGPKQKQTIQVTYTPTAETPRSAATVEVQSTDPEQPNETVNIAFQAVPNGQCTPELVPLKLNFGLVAGGYGKQLPILVRNKGAGVCDVIGVQLKGNGLLFGESPFKIANLPFQPFALGPGEQNLVYIDYFPYSGGDTEEFAAQIVFKINDRLNGVNGVACPSPPFDILSGDLCAFSGGITPSPPGSCWACVLGKTGDPALAAVPGVLDFGPVTLGCNSQTVRVKVYNKGNAPTNLQSITLDSSCGGPFTVAGVPPMPVSMPAGNFVEFEVTYTPGSQAEDSCNVTVTGDTETFTIPLLGEGTTDENVTDVFDQVSGRKVDVLFVIDNSGSMGGEQSNLAANFSSFISAAQTWNVDFHIGVTTTDSGDQGQLQARNGRPRFLTTSTPDLTNAFEDNIQVGTSGSATERGLKAAEEALSDPNITEDVPGDCGGSTTFGFACGGKYSCDTIDNSCGGYNARFLREDAALEIIFVSDESDQSPAVLDFYADFFKSIKGFKNSSLMHVHAIVGVEDNGGGCSTNGFQRYKDIADRTGGLKESLCGNFAATLGNIGNNAFGLRVQFFLSRVPVPATIQVSVDGVDLSTGWTYDPSSNAVIFDETAVPPAQSTVQFDYKAACF